MLLRDIQREHLSARWEEVEDEPPAQEVKWSYEKELTPDQKDQMHRLVKDDTHHFAFGMHDLGRYTTHQMRLDRTDIKPVFFLRHHLTRVEWDIIDNKVEELAKFGLIEPATCSYAAATVLLVKKDADGNYTDRRMCADYRILNLKTKHDRYPMPIP